MITIATTPHYQPSQPRKVVMAPVSVALLLLVEQNFSNEAHVELAEPTKLIVSTTFYGYTDTTTYSGSKESLHILLRAAGLQLLLRESRTRVGGISAFNPVEQKLYLETLATEPFIATKEALEMFGDPDRRFIFAALCEPTCHEEVKHLSSMDMQGLFAHIARNLLCRGSQHKPE